MVIDGKISKTRNVDIEINDIPRRYVGLAIVEISKSGMSGESVREAIALDSVVFERMSVRDYGVGIFLEKIKAAGVKTGDLGPVELLDMLGSDAAKEKVVATALDKLIG